MSVEQAIYEMLIECTGVAMCDSGGAYGRNWEHNQGKTLKDFEAGPAVMLDTDEDGNIEEFGYTISVFHYLTRQLDTDAICETFNKENLRQDDWDDDRFYGVSTEAGKILDSFNVEVQKGFNSYNSSDHLSQTIQGTYCQIADNGYVILQIHGGCDVRGGYTNARLFRIDNDYCDYGYGFLAPQDVYGAFTPNDADLKTPSMFADVSPEDVSGIVHFGSGYDGETLTIDNTNLPVKLNTNEGTIVMSLGI